MGKDITVKLEDLTKDELIYVIRHNWPHWMPGSRDCSSCTRWRNISLKITSSNIPSF